MKRFIYHASVICLLSLSSAYAEQFIPATDSSIHYVGRTWIENSTVRLTWPGSSLQGRFTGASLKLVLASSLKNSLWVKIDQNDWQALNDLGNKKVIDLTPAKLPVGVHSYIIVKKTEGHFGPLNVKGLLINNQEILLPPLTKSKKKIEFIGDSVTAGRAVYGKSSPTNDDARVTYGYQAAERLNAEVWLTAVSGIGVTHNYGTTQEENTMPQSYKRLDFDIETSSVDFHLWQPDVVVINLGSNDNSAPCDTTLFETRFKEFLTEIRTLHPKSWIVVLRTFGGWFEKNENKIVASRKKEGDHKITFIDTTGWLSRETDYTDGGHPNLQGHQKATEKIIPILKDYLK